MLKKSLTSSDKIEFPLFSEWKDNLLDIIVIFTTLITLVATFLYGATNKLKYDNVLGGILGFIYVAFLIVATVIAAK